MFNTGDKLVYSSMQQTPKASILEVADLLGDESGEYGAVCEDGEGRWQDSLFSTKKISMIEGNDSIPSLQESVLALKSIIQKGPVPNLDYLTHSSI